MGEAEKISSLLAISAFLMWPILFSGSSLFFSERQKGQLSELGKVKASLWRLGKRKPHQPQADFMENTNLEFRS